MQFNNQEIECLEWARLTSDLDIRAAVFMRSPEKGPQKLDSALSEIIVGFQLAKLRLA